jgi:3-hydroxy-9,10-secoandrosta-1,3,5(10)-triene-9,17-dione monooxygenase
MPQEQAVARPAVPEPDLTPREMVARAEALRPALLERQQETEELSYYPESTHRDFLEAGFYRILQPRRFGGYEFDVPTFVRVITEISRGCPSTGWCLCLASAHVLQVASLFPEQAQADLFGPDGEFRAASFGAPVGVGKRVDGGWELNGTFPYASGAPYSTHFMGQTMIPPEDPDGEPERMMLFVAPRSEWEMLDDWHGVLGMRGSGSNSVRFEGGRIPDHFTVPDVVMVDVDVTGGTEGSRLHGNPMYAGRTLGFFHAEFGAIVVGTAKAALDEYERIITTRKTTWPPHILRSLHPDYQRHLGKAMGQIATAEAAVIQGAEQFMERCRMGVEEDVPFDLETDQLLEAIGANASRLAWQAMEGILFHTGGSSGARDGQRMQRYFRDMATYWSHNTPSQSDTLAMRLGMLHLGLPPTELPEPPATGT